MFRCGSFNPEEDDLWSTSSSPRRSRRKSNNNNNNNNKNPYSARGLDKFAMVLADLEERRQKIIEQRGSSDVALVRFVYSNSHDWVPIVVKPRDQKQAKPNAVDAKNRPTVHNSDATAAVREVAKPPEPERRKKKFSWDVKKDDCGVFLLRWWKSSYYWSMVLILILLSLVIFGRSFAILCTTTLWYAVPTINGVDANGRRSMKKKEYTRKLSEKKMVVDRASELSPRPQVNLRKRG